MNTAALLIHIESWAREELAAQGRLAEILTAKEAAVRGGRTFELAECGVELEEELCRGPERERRRRQLAEALGKRWGIAARTLSLSSIVERASAEGEDTARLSELRDELRAAVADVVRRARRLSSLARHHQGLLDDLMRILTGSSEAGAVDGVLVDAEA